MRMGMRLVLHNTTCAMPAISVRLAVLDTNCSIINARILRVEESFSEGHLLHGNI